jgi:hypothetical protein
MSLSRAAALEARTASIGLAAHVNAWLLNGSTPFDAVLDRSVATLGEFNLTEERRDRITVMRSAAATFANGQAITADPARYTSAEIAAMGKSSWKLDRVDKDDGLVVSWWLK